MNSITNHRHIWKRSNRKHGRPDRIFIECADPECGQVMQSPADHIRPYTTGTARGGKTKFISFRLGLPHFEKLRRAGIDVRKVVEKFLDDF